jgi:hypothetical protein
MVTVKVPLPPAASAVSVLAVSVGAQRDDDGAVTLVVDEDPQLAQNTSSQTHRNRETWCDIGPRDRSARSSRVRPHVADGSDVNRIKTRGPRH